MRGVAVFALVAALMLDPAAGIAEEGADASAPDAIDVYRHQNSLLAGFEPGHSHRRSGAAYNGPFMVDYRIRTRDGQRCLSVVSVPGDPTSAQARNNESTIRNLLTFYPLCADSPPPPNRPTPAQAADLAWRERVQLPSPRPYIAPGFAITGKRAYLELNAQPTIDATFTAFGYDVAIQARSSVDIDWGDGITETNVTRQGGPYPNGDITHIYTHAKPTNTITVTQRWTADWRIGATTGTISDAVLQTTGQFSFETRELQAVRKR